jgi:DUF917 family protein
MEDMGLRTLHDCEDLLEGALWLGTGGGGSLAEGLARLAGVLDEGLPLGWTAASAIPDDVWTVTVGLHGSLAPPSKETLAEIEALGWTEDSGEGYVARAVKELGAFLGHEYGCLVPAELGPDSVAISLAVGARLGIPVVDGDYVGRAVPEEMQSTYCLHGKQSHLLASVDRWGSVTIVKETAHTQALERIAKMLAVAAFGDTAVATTPLVAREMKEIVVPGTLSQCLAIGRSLRCARESGSDPTAAALETTGGWRLFEGILARLDTDDRDGYLFGTARIAGTGAFRDQNLDVWFKNENQISWLNGEAWVCSPDLLSLVYADSGRGMCNAELAEGDQVVVVGLKGLKGFRTQRGLELAGPGHYGFDIDYVPIEDLMGKARRG